MNKMLIELIFSILYAYIGTQSIIVIIIMQGRGVG